VIVESGILMAIGKVNKQSVDSLRAGPKAHFLWDEKLRGFGVKVTPAGNKVFILQYRLGGRSTPVRRYTIGRFDPWSPEQAREKARALKRLVDDGIDPATVRFERVRAATEFTVKVIADRFIKEYLERRWKKSHKLAKRTLETRLLPILGAKPIVSIDEADVEAVIAAIPVEMKGARRHAYAIMHRFFSWAVDVRDIPIDRSPAARVEAPEGPAEREHTLADWELRFAWLAADKLGYPFGPMYRLLILTGQRREEVAGLDWRELNRATADWQLPSTRSKNGVGNAIHLTDAALAELDGVAGGTKWPKHGLVFTTTGKTSVSGHSRAKRRLDAEIRVLNTKEAAEADEQAVDIAPFRVHDFRRTMATGMQRLGFRWEVIEACENRISGQARKGAGVIYQRHDWAADKKVAWEAWAAHVQSLVNASGASNVVPLVISGT
jgi:integrase